MIAWQDAERRILDRISGMEFSAADLQSIQCFLANLSVAVALDAPQLLRCVTRWLSDYLNARKMTVEQHERLFRIFEDELEPLMGLYSEEGLSRIFKSTGNCEPEITPRRKTLNDLAQRYLSLILNREGAAARNLLLAAAIEGTSIQFLYCRVVEPVLSEIGRLWLENKISVADEHYGTAISQAVLVSLHAFIRPRTPRRGKVLLAGVQSELHDLGVRLIADLFEMDGWETFYYGPNLPFEALCSVVEKVKPHIVAISVTLPSHLMELKDAIARIRSLGHGTAVVVGGYPFQLDRSLCKKIGADAFGANGYHAVRVARRLFINLMSLAGREDTDVLRTQQGGPRVRIRPEMNATEELLRLNSELGALHRQLENRNRKVEELNEEKNRFLGMAAHDLRNAVAVVLYSAKLLAKSPDAFNESQRKLLRTLDTTAKSMAELIDKYLDVSRIEAGKFDLHLETVDLVEVATERADVAQLFAEQVGVKMKVTASSQSLYSEVDRARVSQALDNLLLNAIKFSPPGTEVEVCVGKEAGNAVISVLDQGPGIPEDRMGELFKPFGRLIQAGVSEKQGTGLGLHIARRVVEAQGGKIGVRQRKPHGSVFWVSFPSADSRSLKAG